MNLLRIVSLLVLIAAMVLTTGGVLRAQQFTQAVKGTIVDASSGTPLPGASVIIESLSPVKGAATDPNGYFKITEVPIGRHNFKIVAMGYKPQYLKGVLVASGKQTEINLNMLEEVITAKEIEVTGHKNLMVAQEEMENVSARTYSIEETQRYAGNVNDPARMVTVFPGVVGSPSGTNDIIVRGNSPRGILWRMEGMEMPNPNHFSDEGSSGGAISMLNPNVLRNSDFLTAAFPAHYGNASSGVFDLGLRKGNTEKSEFVAQAGTLGIEAQAEGPFKKGGKASYLINYRFSTLALLNATGLKISGNAEPTFQDAAIKINLPTEKYGHFSVYGVGGLNSVIDKVFDKNENLRGQYNGVGGMWMTGLKHIYFLNSNHSIENHFSYSGTTAQSTYKDNPDGVGTKLRDAELTDNTYNNYRFHSFLSGKLNTQWSYKTGFTASSLGYKLDFQTYDDDLSRLSRSYGTKGSGILLQPYTAMQYRPTDNLTLNGGLHVMHFSINKQTNVEPRLGLTYQVNEKHSLNLGSGMHSRVDPISLYMVEKEVNGVTIRPNQNLQFARTAHFVAGHNFSIRDGLNLKTELYFQHLYDVPVGIDSNSYRSILNAMSLDDAGEQWRNAGKGRNYGIDLGLEKTFSDNYYFSITQSLYRSEFKNPGGAWRSTRYDGRFVTNIIAGKEFKLRGRANKDKTLITNFRLLYAGGVGYTPLNLDESTRKDQSVYNNSKYMAERAPNYTRIDFSIGIRTNKAKSTHTLKLDITNLLNQQPKLGEYYDTYNDRAETPFGLGILPNLVYRVEF